VANQTFDIREILKLIPHRWPFVMVDRVTAYEGGDALTAIKNVTYNESFFPGHFPAVPTMPGVLILEAMAQACGILAVLKSGVRPESGLILYFAGIDKLVFTVRCDKQKRDLWKFSARATVGDELACEAEMMCVLRPPVA
jgi:3-hydroxyacyl-[acyl-carrier-protein] dehydratase